MRNRKTVYALLAVAVLMALCAVQSRRLAEHRRSRLPEAGATYSADVPPALTFVMAGLGGFRGVVSEILWFRIARLQDEGRFLELVQLADWITRLDPYASEGWVYNAWNLSYNISVLMNRHEDRLRWVQNGISLLRDEGLRFNPRDARLYRELAWLYQNKVGDALDTSHLAYKFHLLEAMAPCVNLDGTLNAGAAATAARLAELRMDAGRMLEMERRFGPLDWRVPESHAVYWAEQGVACAAGNELMMSRRAVYQPLMLSVFRGRFAGSLAERVWRVEPNLALAVPAAEYMMLALGEYPTPNQVFVTLRYLATVARMLSEAGQDDAAQQVYRHLAAAVPPPRQAPTFEEVLKGWSP